MHAVLFVWRSLSVKGNKFQVGNHHEWGGNSSKNLRGFAVCERVNCPIFRPLLSCVILIELLFLLVVIFAHPKFVLYVFFFVYSETYSPKTYIGLISENCEGVIVLPLFSWCVFQIFFGWPLTCLQLIFFLTLYLHFFFSLHKQQSWRCYLWQIRYLLKFLGTTFMLQDVI